MHIKTFEYKNSYGEIALEKGSLSVFLGGIKQTRRVLKLNPTRIANYSVKKNLDNNEKEILVSIIISNEFGRTKTENFIFKTEIKTSV